LKRSLPGAAMLSLAFIAQGAALPGQPAPAFARADVNGQRVRLADLKGRDVAPQRNNPSCPFEQKHDTSGNVPAMQQRFISAGMGWLTIHSTASARSAYLGARAAGRRAETPGRGADHGAAGRRGRHGMRRGRQDDAAQGPHRCGG